MIEKEILQAVRQIEIGSRSIINEVMAGAYHSSFKGNGMEFAEVREYMPGDDIRSIDWNVTARTGAPHIKKYVEERELSVLLVVDASSSADFGSGKRMKGEVMATLCALVSFAAIRNNDKVGLLIFTSHIELYIPPAKGKKHVLRVIRELLYFKPKEKGTNLNNALEYAGKILKRKSVVMVVSDFEDDHFEKPLRILGKRHDLLAVSVLDPRELELPSAGFLEFEDPETGETVLVDTGSSAFRTNFAKMASKQVRENKKLLHRHGIDHVQITVKEDSKQTIAPLLEYFRKRSKEIRRRG